MIAGGVAVQGVAIDVPEKPTSEMIFRLRDVLRSAPGEARVYLVVQSGGSPKKIATEYSVAPSRDIMRRIASVVGEDKVRVL